MIFASIRHNLANLLRFSGRDSRASFWPYAITIFLLSMVVDLLLFVPIVSDMMTRTMAYAQAHPEGFPKAAAGQPQVLPPELMPDIGRMVGPMTAVSIATILLLAAAIVRRLHDRDKIGWWGALPLPFDAVAYFMGFAAARTMTVWPPKPSPLTAISSVNSLCWWVAIIVLIVMLVGEGTRGPNRFGEEPRGTA
jgi:uncharacterized membrane protein YhaH (DUF805 family)